MTNEKEEKERRGMKEKEKRNLNLKKTFQSYINFNINFEKLVFARGGDMESFDASTGALCNSEHLKMKFG